MGSRPSSASRTRNLCRREEEGTDSFAIGATSAVMASTLLIRERGVARGLAIVSWRRSKSRMIFFRRVVARVRRIASTIWRALRLATSLIRLPECA